MKPVPIRYVRDVAAARAFYQVLGLGHEYSQRPTRRGVVMWTELADGEGAQLALHAIPEEGNPDAPGSVEAGSGGAGELPSVELPSVELSFEADEPLEDVVKRLRAAGYPPETEITDETFGRSFLVRDPEGLLIQVNFHDRDPGI